MIDWRWVNTVSVLLLFLGSTVGTSLPALDSEVLNQFSLAQSLVESEPITIISNWDLLEWPGVGTEDEPVVIEGLRIKSSTYCINISSTTVYFVITDCVFEASDASEVVVLESVTNGVIEDCSISGGGIGVSLLNSFECRIAGCDITGFSTGILLAESSNCTLSGNRVHGGEQGIAIDRATNSTVVSNDIFNNNADGLRLTPFSSNNGVYLNAIGWNAAGDETTYKDARDDGQGNTWDNGTHGNFWTDGISGATRRVFGSANAVDIHPFSLTDEDSPVAVLSPEPVVMTEQTSTDVTWSATDRFPVEYRLYLGEDLFQEGDWVGGNVTITLSPSVGEHHLTMIFIDCSDNQVNITATIQVVWRFFGGLGTEIVFMSSLLSAIAVMVTIVVVKMIRR